MVIRTLFAAGMAMMLAACAAQTGSVGVHDETAAWDDVGHFQPHESRFNSFLFLKPWKGYKTRVSKRENGIHWKEEIITTYGPLNEVGIFLTIEYTDSADFSLETENRMLKRASFENLASKFPMPSDGYKKIDQNFPRIKGWVATTGKCSVGHFAKRFNHKAPFESKNTYSNAIVQFFLCSNLLVTPVEFANRIDLISENEKQQIRQAYQSFEIPPFPEPAKNPPEPHAFAGEWESISSNLKGPVHRINNNRLVFSLETESPEVSCSGFIINSKMSTHTGTWNLSCNDGKTADGIWNMPFDGRPITGSGFDTRKRKITFELK
ncbi:MAG: hypothetical protein ABID63_03060 [Pseudomonadota bacterium]